MAKKKISPVKKGSQNRKRGTAKKRNRSSFLNLLILIIICFSAGFLTYAALDYTFNRKNDTQIIDNKKQINRTDKNEISNTKRKIYPKIEKEVKIEIKKDKDIDDKTVSKNDNGDLQEYVNSFKIDENTTLPNQKDEIKVVPQSYDVKEPSRLNKPKLVLIIDDVASKEHVRGIKSLNTKITPSFFPPSKDFPDTPNLAKKFEFYMIHLPLEAMGHNSKRIKTLMTTDDYAEIERVVRNVRRDFPSAIFLNNHTGSKFTSNLNSMRMLAKALNKYNFKFLDSKTIAPTKVKQVAKEQGFRYIYRDVFLDNIDNEFEIKKQLKEAIGIANKKGYAIAIGHPRKNTFKAIKNSKDILSKVELVYLDEIYEYYR